MAPPVETPRAAPIRIVRVHARLVGGSAINSVLLTAGLEDETFRSTLVTGSAGEHETDMAYFARQHGVEPRVIPEMGREVSWRDDLAAIRKLVRLMRDIRPHIVHTHASKAGAIGRVAAVLAGVPIRVHTYHGLVFRGYFSPLKSKAIVWIERMLGWFTSRVIAISGRQLDEICDLHHVASRSNCSVVPLGFDLQPFTVCDRRRGELRRILGCPEHWKLVGIVGRLVPIKNHELLLEAAERICATRDDVGFVIVGDGELQESLEASARRRGLTSRVFFVGWLREMDVVYADLDIVALTSFQEGTPVSLIEAMAARRAVASTEVGGVADVVRDGESGLLFRSGDVEGCTRALLRLLDDPALRERIGRQGQERSLSVYRAERLVGDVRALYLDLLARKGLRSAVGGPAAPSRPTPASPA